MGMMLDDALVLAKVAGLLAHRHRVLTLGVPTLNFGYPDFHRLFRDRIILAGGQSKEIGEFHDHKGFFRSVGFENVSSLDISAYEGADVVGDLNDLNLAEKIGTRYDLVYDSGTIENIFAISTALRTMSRLTEVGGAVVHISPANGFMDHGFWQ